MTVPKLFPVVSADEARQSVYPYVFVNDDGSVRELHGAERSYLEEPFSPFDGARPYVKTSYHDRDGWGSIQGFCRRSHVPAQTPIGDAPPEDPNAT